MTTHTREQIDAAVARLASFRKAFFASADIDDALATVIDAIPALTAELEAERRAHEETRRLLAVSESNIAAAHARDAAMTEQITAWQSTTGRASTEAYRASRCEPGSDVIERLSEEVRIAWVAWAKTQPNPKSSWLVPWAELGQQDQDADRAIARHLVAALAEMGAGDVLPTDDEILAACVGLRTVDPELVRVVVDVCRTRLAPVLGARRSLEAAAAPPTDEQLAEEAARYIAREYGFGEAEAASIHAALEREPTPEEEDEALASARGYLAGARREGRR